MKLHLVKAGIAGAFVAAMLGGTLTPANAQLIASDSYKIGSTPASGQYANNTSLASQASVTVQGFTNSLGGSGTSQFQSQTGGLNYTAYGADSTTSGKVTYLATGLDNTGRSTARNLATPIPTSSTYWFGYLLNRGAVSGSTGLGFVLTGFGAPGEPIVGSAGIAGLFAGYSGDSGNLVLRYRDTSNLGAETTLLSGAGGALDNNTYLVIASVDVNVGGGIADNVSYWVNPTDLTSTATLTSTSAASGAFTGNLLSAPSDITRLNYLSRNWNSSAFFDEPRLGTSLASISGITASAAPEPGSFALLGTGALTFAGMCITRRRRKN